MSGESKPAEGWRLRSFLVRGVEWGDTLTWSAGRLIVPREELCALVLRDERLAGVRAEIVRPGERVRLIHVLDAVEPRAKPGGGSPFPGFLGPPDLAGRGLTDRLGGMAVLTLGEIPGQADSQAPKEAILDMWGPGAVYQPFSGLTNLVLELDFQPGVGKPEAVAASRLAALRAAAHVARAVATAVPDGVECLAETAGGRLPAPTPELPGVVYVCLAMREGEVHSTYLYGRPVESLPALLHPSEVQDGALVSGDYWIACHRTPTYYYQNDRIVRALMERDGVDLSFRGVLVCRCLVPSQQDKHRQAAQTAKLARLLGASGAVVGMSNGGHAYADQMLICQHLERSGVASALSVDEYADADGSDFPLVTVVPEAVAIVSNGNQEEIVELPAADRVLGGSAFLAGNSYEAGFSRSPGEALVVALRQMYCSTSQSGFGNLRCCAY